MKKRFIIFSIALMIFCLNGCQTTPKQNTVVQKNDLKEQLTQSTEEPTDVSAYAAVLPEHLEKSFEKAKSTVTMDADVICDLDYATLPVYQFQRAALPQERLDEWIHYFVGDAKLYAWPALYTKAYYQEQLIEAQKGSEVDGELVVDEEYIARLKEYYAKAPDGKERRYIDSAYDLAQNSRNDEKIYLNAAAELDGDDCSIYATTLKSNGEGYSEFKYSAGMQVISEITISDALKLDGYGSLEEDTERIRIGTISEEAAKPIAENLLKDLGITGMKCVKSGKACLESFKNQFGISSDRAEIGGIELLYLREIGGLTVDADIADVINDTEVYDQNGTLLTAPSIRVEKIRIFISNEGEIEYFDYNAMLEESETLSEGVVLKDFDEITERAAQQLYYETVYAGLSEFRNEIEIDSVSLVMTYALAENELNSVLLVPAWNFSGTNTYYDENGSVLSTDSVSVTINAVDGSRA